MKTCKPHTASTPLLVGNVGGTSAMPEIRLISELMATIEITSGNREGVCTNKGRGTVVSTVSGLKSGKLVINTRPCLSLCLTSELLEIIINLLFLASEDWEYVIESENGYLIDIMEII